MNLEIKRQFWQIYTEFDRLTFDARTRTQATFRAIILTVLSLPPHELREVIPNNKQRSVVVEDVIRINNPEAEIKYGFTCQTFYVQVSVSCHEALFKLNNQVLNAIRKWSGSEEQ